MGVGLAVVKWPLPVLLLEVLWKVVWVSLVAVPRAVSGDLGRAFTEVLVSFVPLVAIAAVLPWRHVWRTSVLRPRRDS